MLKPTTKDISSKIMSLKCSYASLEGFVVKYVFLNNMHVTRIIEAWYDIVYMFIGLPSYNKHA